MFSYGAEPKLPNVGDSQEEILSALKENVRLPMPAACPQYVYTNIMAPCWYYDYEARPSFAKLWKTIKEALGQVSDL